MVETTLRRLLDSALVHEPPIATGDREFTAGTDPDDAA